MFNSIFLQAAQATCTVNGQPADCSEFGGFLAGAGLIIVGLIAFATLTFAFQVWMFIHALKHSENKILWAFLIFFAPFIGALIYFFTEKKKARSNTSSQSEAQPFTPTVANNSFASPQDQAAAPTSFTQQQSDPAQPQAAPAIPAWPATPAGPQTLTSPPEEPRLTSTPNTEQFRPAPTDSQISTPAQER